MTVLFDGDGAFLPGATSAGEEFSIIVRDAQGSAYRSIPFQLSATEPQRGIGKPNEPTTSAPCRGGRRGRKTEGRWRARRDSMRDYKSLYLQGYEVRPDRSYRQSYRQLSRAIDPT